MADGSTSDGFRGHVVLLFSDLCDFTKLGERVDPEEVDLLRRELEQRVSAVVEVHGGVISQVYGDGVLAVFGYPDPREDDPQRAVDAALAMHEAVRALPARHGFVPRLHTGVHAGLVFVRAGDALHGKYELTGDTVNTCARLCEAAQRDEVVVSSALLSGIEGLFVLTPEEQLTLKGKSSPVHARRVRGRLERTRFEARAQRGVTSFVGRGDELGQLQEALAGARAGRLRTCVLVGPPGIGKTRLLAQLGARADGMLALSGSCESFGDTAPLEPFRQLLRRFCGVPASDGLAAVERALGARLSSNGVTLESLELARFCVAQEGDARARARGLRSFVQALLARTPLLLMLDDWQWADDASRSLLEQLLTSHGSSPLCVVIGMRPSDSMDPLLQRARVLALAPFDEQESARVIHSLRPQLMERSAVRAIHERAGGNPLFVEELCRSLPEDHDLQRALAGAPASTVQGVIRVRIAALPKDQARLLGVAAVLGSEFSAHWLARIGALGASRDALDELARGDLLQPGELAGTYRFKHGITREVVYESVRIAERRRIHGALAEAMLREHGPEHASEHAEALAHHFHGSGDYERAAHHAELAGARALGGSALDRARAQYEVALRSLDRLAPAEDHKQRWLGISTRWALACVYSPARGQLALLERAVGYADELAETGARAQTRDAIGWIYYVLGDYAQATRHYRSALALAEAARGDKLVAQLWANLGQTHAAAGRYPEALAWLSRSIEAKRGGARSGSNALALGFAYALACRAVVHAHLGDFAPAERDIAEALQAVAGAGHAIEGSVLSLQAMLALHRGQLERAARSAAQARTVAERVHSPYVFATATAYECYAAFLLEREPAVLRRCEQAVAQLERREQGLFLSFAHARLAHAQRVAGELRAAEDSARRALARAPEGDPLGEASACRALARLDATGRVAWLTRARRSADERGSALERALTELLAHELGCSDGARPAADLSAWFAARDMPEHAARAAAVGF